MNLPLGGDQFSYAGYPAYGFHDRAAYDYGMRMNNTAAESSIEQTEY